MSYEMERAQTNFLADGGVLMRVIGKLKDAGAMDKTYTYREYPKMLRISLGLQDVKKQCEDIDKRKWVETENKEVFQEIVVSSEDEEERVLSGGKTSTQIEDERQGLLRRAAAAGVKADPSWSAVRLRRELGEKMDAPEPVDSMAALKQKLAHLEEMAAMKAKIEALEAQLAKPAEDMDTMRAELSSLGVRVDGRWSATRLREELDRATAA